MALEALVTEGEVPLKYAPLSRYRGSFFLAVLLSLPGVVPKTGPTRAVVSDRDALERFLVAPPLEFREMLKTAREQARQAGIRKSDIEAAIHKVWQHA
jgi:hypothetical protein